MNREFMYLNDKEVAVTNEKGEITKRPAERDMRNILVSEDKLEALDNQIDHLKGSIKIEEASVKIIDKWYKVMAGLSAFIVITAPLTLGIANGLGLIGFWAVVSAAACGYGVYSQRDAVKRINGYNREIKRAKSLKAEIENDLSFTKELEKDYTVPSHKIGEVVKIDSTKDFEQQDNQLHRAFRVGYKNTPKVLVKTRNNQNKK